MARKKKIEGPPGGRRAAMDETRMGAAGIDQPLQALSDEELDALVERARGRGRHPPEAFIATVIGEALRAARAS